MPLAGIEEDEDFLLPKTDNLTRILFTARRINSTSWEVDILEGIWDEVSLEPVKVEIFIEDFAGNIAEFDFILIKNDHPLSFTYSKWIVFAFTVLILISGSVYATISYKMSKIPRIPVEIAEHIKFIDPDLLDLILQTANPMIAQKLIVYLHRLGDQVDLDYVTLPDLRALLNTPFQPVDLEEIHNLITTFKMEPLSQENFLRGC